jgi:hypothetical protein
MNSKEEAQELLDSRVAVYGERVKNMENVAKVFSGILGIEVRPDQVPLLMVGYKTVRASQTPDYEDNVKDIEGYAIMFREIIGDDMIAAVNTDEYLKEKTLREGKAQAESELCGAVVGFCRKGSSPSTTQRTARSPSSTGMSMPTMVGTVMSPHQHKPLGCSRRYRATSRARLTRVPTGTWQSTSSS